MRSIQIHRCNPPQREKHTGNNELSSPTQGKTFFIGSLDLFGINVLQTYVHGFHKLRHVLHLRCMHTA